MELWRIVYAFYLFSIRHQKKKKKIGRTQPQEVDAYPTCRHRYELMAWSRINRLSGIAMGIRLRVLNHSKPGTPGLIECVIPFSHSPVFR